MEKITISISKQTEQFLMLFKEFQSLVWRITDAAYLIYGEDIDMATKPLVDAADGFEDKLLDIIRDSIKSNYAPYRIPKGNDDEVIETEI